jgi:hypothetical protein
VKIPTPPIVRSHISFLRKLVGVMRIFRKYGYERSVWILTYLEESLGGYRSRLSKLPFDKNNNPLPWYTYPAIAFIDQLDFTGCHVFEYGSGNSSKFWSGRSLSVTSVEINHDWYQTVLNDLSPNNSLIYAPSAKEYVTSINKSSLHYDVIVVDGSFRFDCAGEAVKKLSQGGIIILDNSDWYPSTARYLRDMNFCQVDFIGAGPLNSYAWCTSILFMGDIRIPRKFIDRPINVIDGLTQIGADDRPML